MENPNINSVDPESNLGAPPAESPRKPDLIPEIPPPVQSKKETTHCKPDQTPLWKMILETAAVFVGLYVAGVYHGQLVVMQGQLGEIIKQFPEIQKSAKAARDSADLSRQTLNETIKNFSIDERAWLAPQFVKGQTESTNFMGLAFWDLDISNIGKTQAIKVHGIAKVSYIPEKTAHLPFGNATDIAFNPAVVYSSTPHIYGISVVRRLDNGMWGGVTWDQVLPQVHKRDFLFGYGKISYHDIFNDTTHVVTFCTMLIGGFTPTKKGEPMAGFNLRQQCSDYNRAYDEH